MSDRSGTEKRQRTKILPVRLTEAEQTALAERAERTGYSRAALVRYGLFQTPLPRAVSRPTVDHKVVAQLLGELGKIGSNVNQLAKHANAGRYQTHSVELAMRELLVLRASCLKALGHNR